MNILSYVEQKKKLYELFLNFFESECIDEIQSFINFHNHQNFYSNSKELKLILQLISVFFDNHHKFTSFISKIEKLLLFIFNEKDIQQILTNDEIFDIFINNKRILLFLIKKELILFDQHVIETLYMKNNTNGTFYRHFFYPELKPHIQTRKAQKIEKELSKFGDIFDNFEEKRLIGENDKYICTLIRQDSVEEFIIYVNKTNLSLSSRIQSSIFETNSFLSNRNPTLIEYAAFFGSIQIFQYMQMNGVKLEYSLWLYAIHGNNPDIIYLLEKAKIHLNYENCLKESIKCHHNNIANYIHDNYNKTDDKINDDNFDNNIFEYSFRYHNYAFFPNNFVNNYVLCYLCKYDYATFVDLLLKEKSINYNFNFKSSKLKNKISPLYLACINNNKYIVNLLLQQPKIEFIPFSFCNNKSLFKITIPSYLTIIEDNLFYGCSSLKNLIIPKSITRIKNGSFEKCSSLVNIIIPSSVEEIGNRAFKDCTSLINITIPSSVKTIGENAFENCSSLVQITIPKLIHNISYCMFKRCKSLKNIQIESNLISIGAYSFSECSSLTEFKYSSEQTMIRAYTFFKCTSLKNVNVPSYTTKIGTYAFYGCKSLEKIDLPDSINEINESAFQQCSSLKQIKIPFCLKVVEPKSFSGCSSLEEVQLFNVVRIGRSAFADCERLKNVQLPPTLNTIRSQAFDGCPLLKEIKIPQSVKCIDDNAFNENTLQLKTTC